MTELGECALARRVRCKRENAQRAAQPDVPDVDAHRRLIEAVRDTFARAVQEDGRGVREHATARRGSAYYEASIGRMLADEKHHARADHMVNPAGDTQPSRYSRHHSQTWWDNVPRLSALERVAWAWLIRVARGKDIANDARLCARIAAHGGLHKIPLRLSREDLCENQTLGDWVDAESPRDRVVERRARARRDAQADNTRRDAQADNTRRDAQADKDAHDRLTQAVRDTFAAHVSAEKWEQREKRLDEVRALEKQRAAREEWDKSDVVEANRSGARAVAIDNASARIQREADELAARRLALRESPLAHLLQLSVAQIRDELGVSDDSARRFALGVRLVEVIVRGSAIRQEGSLDGRGLVANAARMREAREVLGASAVSKEDRRARAWAMVGEARSQEGGAVATVLRRVFGIRAVAAVAAAVEETGRSGKGGVRFTYGAMDE